MAKSEGQKRALMFALFLGVAFCLFGRSLPYDYVFDDIWKMVKNPAVESMESPRRYFLDPSTLSGYAPLNVHNYRPLLTLSQAVERKVLGPRPAPRRFINIVLLGVNAGLVSAIGVEVLAVSPAAALLAGLLFLVHPAQVETTVWISERSGLLALTFFLSGLLLWKRLLGQKSWKAAAALSGLFLAGVFIRENMVMFPLACLLLQRLEDRDKLSLNTAAKAAYGTMGAVLIFYLALRTWILGQVAQTSLWGGSIYSNLLVVMEGLARTTAFIFWPTHASPYHEISVPTNVTPWVVAGLILIVALATGFRRRFSAPRLSFCAGLFLLLWLPTSNLIPVAITFADRFAAPLLIPVGWASALLIDRWSARRLTTAVTIACLVFFSFQTWAYVPSWQNEVTLWQRVVKQDPHSNFGWFCWGVALENRSDWTAAEQSYRNALVGKTRSDFAGQIFVHLARTVAAQGRLAEAQALAEKGLVMRPDLKPAWEKINENPGSADGTLEFLLR